jgi:hypothetical protein
MTGGLQVDLTAKYGWRRLHHKLTGGGALKSRAKRLDIAQNAEVLEELM